MVQVVISNNDTFPSGTYLLTLHQSVMNAQDWEVRITKSDTLCVVVQGVDHATAMIVFQSMKSRFEPRDFFPHTNNKIDRIKAIREHYGAQSFGVLGAKRLAESGLILTGDIARDFNRLCERLPPNFQV
jgi:hypothetical protein